MVKPMAPTVPTAVGRLLDVLFLLLEMKMIICHGAAHKAKDVEQECYMIE